MPRTSVLILSLLLLLASVSIAQLAAAGGQDEGASRYGRTLLEQINLYRQDNGLSQLRFDANLIQIAKTHSFAMSQQKRLSHQHFDQRFERSGSRMCVENVGWNYSTPLKQFDAWRQSSGHDQNMLAAEINKAGIADIGTYVTFFACK